MAPLKREKIRNKKWVYKLVIGRMTVETLVCSRTCKQEDVSVIFYIPRCLKSCRKGEFISSIGEMSNVVGYAYDSTVDPIHCYTEAQFVFRALFAYLNTLGGKHYTVIDWRSKCEGVPHVLQDIDKRYHEIKTWTPDIDVDPKEWSRVWQTSAYFSAVIKNSLQKKGWTNPISFTDVLPKWDTLLYEGPSESLLRCWKDEGVQVTFPSVNPVTEGFLTALKPISVSGAVSRQKAQCTRPVSLINLMSDNNPNFRK